MMNRFLATKIYWLICLSNSQNFMRLQHSIFKRLHYDRIYEFPSFLRQLNSISKSLPQRSARWKHWFWHFLSILLWQEIHLPWKNWKWMILIHAELKTLRYRISKHEKFIVNLQFSNLDGGFLLLWWNW